VSPPPEYWLAVVTIVPIVALAVVVEARALAAGWTSAVPRAYRRVQSWLWVALALAFVLIEAEALPALRGLAAPTWVPTFSEVTIQAALSYVLISSAVDLIIRAHAEVVAKALTWHPILNLRERYLARVVVRKKTKVRKGFELMRRTLDSGDRTFDDLEAKIRLTEELTVDEVGGLMRELEANRIEWRRKRADAEQWVDAEMSETGTLEQRLSDWRAAASAELERQRGSLAEQLLRGRGDGGDRQADVRPPTAVPPANEPPSTS
jgi:hypothetical protein